MAVSGTVVKHGGGVTGSAITTGLGPVLKEEWGDEVTSQFNNEALCYAVLSEGAEDELWQGEYYVEPLHTGRHRSGSAGRETDDYPSTGTQGYDQLKIGVSFYRTSGQITSKAMLAAEQGDASAVRALTADIRGALRDLIQEVNVDCYGTQVGVLGELSADSGANAVVLKNAHAGGDYWEAHGTRYFSGGRSMPVMVGTYNGAEGAGTIDIKRLATVTSVDSRTGLTLSTGEDVVAGDVILRLPSANTTDFNIGGDVGESLNFGLVGLEQIIDDGTTMPVAIDDDYFGKNRSENAILHSVVRDEGGAALTEAKLQNFLDAIAETSGEQVDCMLMHRSVRTELMNLFQGDRRFTPQQYAGGFKGEYLVYNPGDGDIGVFVDRHCTYDTIYAVNKEYLKRYTLSGAHLVDYDGSALRQSGSGPAWQWNIEAYFNMACTKPNTCGKMFNISADQTFGDASFLPAF